MTDMTASRSGPLTSCALVSGAALIAVTLSVAVAGRPNPLTDAREEMGAVLVGVPHGVAQLLLAGAGVATLLAVLAVRHAPASRSRLVTALCSTAIITLVLLVDQTVLTVFGYLPMFLVGTVTGTGVDLTVLWSLPLLVQVLALVAGTCVFLLALRRSRTRYQPHNQIDVHADARVRTRRWALIAIEAPLAYALSRVLMALEVPGFTAPYFTDELRMTGLMLAAGAAGGALLTWGLIRPWGERFPRWMVGLAGRAVPVNLAVVPAITVAVAVMAASRGMVQQLLMGADESVWELPLILLPHLLWPVWSVALALAALHYARRRSTVSPTPVPSTVQR